MRKIYFRGKIINSVSYPEMNGQWYYGYYMQDLDQGVIKHYLFNCPTTFEIDPETLNQFTGLEDKKGVAIFEGDIFKRGTHKEKGQYPQLVMWLEAGARFVQYPISKHDFSGYLNAADFHEGLTQSKVTKVLIIGNSTDNKDLLIGTT